jgi:polar amino acid transport system substrate-binding protein
MLMLLALGSGLSPNALAQGSTPKPLRVLDDIADQRVAVLTGSVHDDVVRRRYPSATVLHFNGLADLPLALKSGKADVAFSGAEPTQVLLRDEPSLGILEANAYTLDLGAGFRHEDNATREAYNAFLKEIRANGIHEDMARRWIREKSEDMPVIPNPGGKGVLRVGVTAVKGLPWGSKVREQHIGFDIELVQRFAASQGKTIQYVDLDLSGLVAALAAGKIDMMGSTLAATEERKRLVSFSDPAWKSDSSVFALKSRLPALAGEANPATVASAAQPESPSFRQRMHANLIHEDRWQLIARGLGVTMIIWVLSSVFGTLLGVFVCMMRMARRAWLRTIADVYIWLLRGIPVLVLLMLMYYVVFASVEVNAVAVASVAFGLNMAAYSAEMFRTAIQSVDKGQIEAGVAGGFTKLEAFRLIVLPQALRHLLPVYKGELISALKMTSVVGYVAVQDITKASDIIRSRTFDAFVPLITTAIIYLLLAWLITWAIGKIEWRITPRHLRAGGQS